MGADKNSMELEKHLRILSQKIRIVILKKLNNSLVPLSYSILRKEITDINQSTINLSFHLKTLKKGKLIESLEEGYQITNIGKKILKIIISMEQILNAQNKTIMIRTSKYSKEPFNINKIEEYLIKEGEMERFHAKKIAQQVEERLSKTNIEYLTAPLMREYINVILLENGLERIRHKLTRLGTPPHEVFKLFKDNSVNPDIFLKRLGSDVSEQFLLLNLLPNELADLYLSGDIKLLNLNYWGLRPLGLYINTESILNFIRKFYSIKYELISKKIEYIDLILKFFDVISQFKPYFSKDILLGGFNQKILSLFNIKEEENNLFRFLLNKMLKLKISFTLEFSNEHKNHLNHQFLTILSSFIDSQTKTRYHIPLVLLEYSKKNEFTDDFLYAHLFARLKKYLIFYNKDSTLLNSSIINIKSNKNNNDKHNQIILDKILINLHSIALQSNQNDDLFYDIIKERLKKTFEFYKIKQKLVHKKLDSLNEWNKIINNFFIQNSSNWAEKSLKSISFFGLNEAIKTHCGIELDRIDTSENFAFKILSLMKSIIKEKAQNDNENYVLSQPHDGDYLNFLKSYTNENSMNNIEAYSMNIIREDSNLSIKKQVSIFKKFEKILNGGAIFSYTINRTDLLMKNLIDYFSKSKLTAFNFK